MNLNHALELKGQSFYAQSGAYIASSPDIQVDTKWEWNGARTFFSREGLSLLKMSGTDNVFLSSYGAIHEIDLEVGQKYVVDTGHMVAFAERVGYSVKRVGGVEINSLQRRGFNLRANRSEEDFHTNQKRRCLPDLVDSPNSKERIGQSKIYL